MPRLFTGIELPEDIVWRLSMMRAGLSGAHWIDPENYHITMRFAGDISDTEANHFADALLDVRFDSFDIELSGLGSFGGNKPRAIWAGVKPSPELQQLQKAHERAARLAGLPPETRNFVPHITLARLRNVSPFAVAEYLARYGGFLTAPFEVSRFVLFSSRPNQGGGPYLVEEGYPSWNMAYGEDGEEAA
jgi:RNA 2',3'-cyclic 3'-phosphodiesterase